MPDDQAKEKSQLLEQFGAEVVLVKPASIVNAKHYVNEAKRLALTDQEIVEMSRFLLREEGIFVGSSSGLNCVAAVRAARKLGPGHTIVTILCDSGQRHLTKFWNEQHIREDWKLAPTAAHLEFLDGSTGQP
ncbi:unnamed protein product [Phytophthora lilii]|uniref:Unnamed protein product n=1 Tax=Phytophthora lilii TaxID=2077276 RepID=A0A9W6TD65_9STRA|nr:unnamed protein product [Phytophthora lilii]